MKLIDEIRKIQRKAAKVNENIEDIAQKLYLEGADLVRSYATDLQRSSATFEINPPGLVGISGATDRVARRVVELFKEQGLSASVSVAASYQVTLEW